jgi:hypothetical protein
LPVGPGVGATRGGTPTVVAAAGAPGITGVKVLSIVTGDPAAHRDAGAQVGAVTGADIDDWAEREGGFRLQVRGPVIIPGGVAAFTATNAGKAFAIRHRHERLAVVCDAAARDCPEVVHLNARTSFRRIAEVIGAHLHTCAFSAAHIAGEIRVGGGGAFGGFGKSPRRTVGFNAAPGYVTLIAGDVDAEEAVGGVVSASFRSAKKGDGGHEAERVGDKSTAFHLQRTFRHAGVVYLGRGFQIRSCKGERNTRSELGIGIRRHCLQIRP